MSKDLPFTVDEWDHKGENLIEVLVRAENLLIARAAFEAACRARPHSFLTLRNKTQVIDTRRPG